MGTPQRRVRVRPMTGHARPGEMDIDQPSRLTAIPLQRRKPARTDRQGSGWPRAGQLEDLTFSGTASARRSTAGRRRADPRLKPWGTDPTVTMVSQLVVAKLTCGGARSRTAQLMG